MREAIPTRGYIKSPPWIAPIFCGTYKEANAGRRGLHVSLAAMCVSLGGKIAEPSRLARPPCLSKTREGLRGRSRLTPGSPGEGELLPPSPVPLQACGLKNIRPDSQVSGVLTLQCSFGQVHFKQASHRRFLGSGCEGGRIFKERCPFQPLQCRRRGPPPPHSP